MNAVEISFFGLLTHQLTFFHFGGCPSPVVKVDLAAWSFATTSRLQLPNNIGGAPAVIAYNGKLYTTSESGNKIAIIDESTFTLDASSPFTFTAPCNAWQMTQYKGVRTSACLTAMWSLFFKIYLSSSCQPNDISLNTRPPFSP